MDETNPCDKNNLNFRRTFCTWEAGMVAQAYLMDRSLRSMASSTAIFAVAMFIILFSYLPDFWKRLNPLPTSMGCKAGESCSIMERQNVECMQESGY